MGEVIIQTSGLTKRYGEKIAVNQLRYLVCWGLTVPAKPQRS